MSLMMARRGSLVRPTLAVAASYADEVLADNPVAYWRLSETAGSTVADEVGTNDGTVYGANLDVSGPGNLGSAAEFDGVDDQVRIPTFGIFDGSHAFSVEFWIRPDSWGTTSASNWQDASVAFAARDERRVMFTQADGCSTYDRIGLRTNQGGWGTRVETGQLTLGEWYHIVGTYDPTDGYVLYQDGQEQDTGSHTGSINSDSGSDTQAFGGIEGGTNRFFDAAMDEVAVYDTVLSAARVQAHYDAAGVT